MRIIPLLFLAACAAEESTAVTSAPLAQTEDGDPVYPSYTNFCRTVTVTGTVFYNDLRINGRFALRDTPTGASGTADPFGGDNSNYLGMRDAQVDIYEVDRNFSNTSASCFATMWMGKTWVDRTGAFSWTGQVCETCAGDLDGGQNEDLSIGVKVSLRNCEDSGTRCFSVRDPGGAGATHHYDDDWDGITWSRWHSGASDTSPRQTGGTAVNVGRYDFGGALSQATRASNVFASMVDVTRKVHVQIGVPFGHPEVAAYFPSSTGGLAHSHESGRLCESDPGAGGWITGDYSMHEYGHLLHYWAWNGHGKWFSYCYNDVNCNESYQTQEYANAAFKEGWADFVAAVALDGTGSALGCDAMEDDNVEKGCPNCVGPDGRHYFFDVTRVLCDVWDAPADCDTRGGTQYCDNTNETLTTMIDALDDEWDHATQDDRDIVIDADENHDAILPTFGICTYIDELSDPGISETFKTTGLDCGQ